MTFCFSSLSNPTAIAIIGFLFEKHHGNYLQTSSFLGGVEIIISRERNRERNFYNGWKGENIKRNPNSNFRRLRPMKHPRIKLNLSRAWHIKSRFISPSFTHLPITFHVFCGLAKEESQLNFFREKPLSTIWQHWTRRTRRRKVKRENILTYKNSTF